LHKDYLGSILAISDDTGNKLEQRHFDAWGNFTHLQMGNGAIITDKNIIDNTSLLIERGYTGHEHFAEVGIIHMNGRLYDPLLRRFLNADENIQDPYNTQNYNKYGYVMNNPLMFNDPSGEFIWFLGAAWAASHIFLATVITGAVIGAAVGVAAYSLGAAISGGKWQLGGALKSMFWGGVSGAVTAGIGSAFAPAAGTVLTLTDKVAGAVAQGLVHGFSQGVLSMMQGGNFTNGFASGASGSWGASMFGAFAGKFASSAAGMIASGAVLGGVASELTGGNFWEGALIGGVVAGLNHYLHQIVNNNKIRGRIDKYYSDKAVADSPVKEGFLHDLQKIFPEIYELSAKNFAIADGANLKQFNESTGNNYVLEGNKLVDGDNGETVNGVTSMGDGRVLISPYRMRTALGFAATWYHEGIHSIHFTTGIFKAWKTRYGAAEASRISEFYAHGMTDAMSGVSMKFSAAFSNRYYPSIYIQSMSSLFLNP
jgi:RHS repeat-associated protein